VIAHEVGHHVQDLLGVLGRAQQGATGSEGDGVRTELQADCYAGVWAHNAEQRGIVHSDDIAAALNAAAAVGDDHLQQMAGRAVSPESWTHGSSAQRESWFNKGLHGGTIQSCNTFGGAMSY